MRVLGIDPGLTRCGLGVVDGVPGRQPQLIAVDVLGPHRQLDTARRLVAIEQAVEEWIALYRPTSVAVERVFAQHNVQTVMGTAQAAGVAMLVAARRGIPVAPAHPERGQGRDHRLRTGRQGPGRRDGHPDPEARRAAEAGRRGRRAGAGHLPCLARRQHRPADRGDRGGRRASRPGSARRSVEAAQTGGAR